MREHVDLPTVEAMDEEWRQRPPVHLLVAGYLGYKARDQVPAVNVDEDASELLAALGDIPIRKVAPIDSDAFDAAMAAAKRESNV